MEEHSPFYRHRRFIRKLIMYHDWDWWTAWDGGEGTGKSTAAIRAALATQQDGGTNHFARHWQDLITYTPEDFLTAIDNAKKGYSIILDEAAEAWYYKDWYSEVHKALDKASVQVRDRNLDIHLCTPRLAYLGKIGMKRIKDWCHVTAPNYERGYMELLTPKWDKYGRHQTPRWDTELFHRFHPLPAEVYDPYKLFKRQAAETRLAKYIVAASGRREDDTRSFRQQVDEVVAQVRENRENANLLNTRGHYDFGSIVYNFGTTVEVARQAVRILEGERPRHAAGLPSQPETRVAGGPAARPRFVDRPHEGGA